MKKQSLSNLIDQSIALMTEMRTTGSIISHKEADSDLYTRWLEVQKQIAQAGNHSESQSSARARAR